MARHTVTVLAVLLALGTVAAVATAAPAGTAPGAAPATFAESASPDNGTTTTPDDLSVRVRTPRTIAENVTQNYSVEVTGADGNVSVEWTFEGEDKRGQTVQHTWTHGGNGTISVTVTDGDGDAVTRELTVGIVEYGSENEDPATPLANLGTLGLMTLFGIVPLALLIFVVPKAIEVFTDAF